MTTPILFVAYLAIGFIATETCLALTHHHVSNRDLLPLVLFWPIVLAVLAGTVIILAIGHGFIWADKHTKWRKPNRR